MPQPDCLKRRNRMKDIYACLHVCENRESDVMHVISRLSEVLVSASSTFMSCAQAKSNLIVEAATKHNLIGSDFSKQGPVKTINGHYIETN